MLRYRLRPPCGAVLLACGFLFLFQADGGAVRFALAQPREVLVGLTDGPAAAGRDRSAQGAAHRALGAEQQAAGDLDAARAALRSGNVRAARRQFEVLVARYPDAAASDRARCELARLYTLPSDWARSAGTSGHPGRGPGGIAADDDGGARLSVSLGAPARSGGSILVQNTERDEPRLTRTAEQDFRLHVGDRVFFDDRSADLSSRARSLLSEQARWLKQVPRATVAIEGHADDQGSAEFNQDLAASRARAVRDWLVAEGVEAGRMALAVYGRQRPVALCPDGTCAAQNRRVVTVLGSARPAAGADAPRLGPSGQSRLGVR